MKIDNHALDTLDACALKYKESLEDHWSPRFKGPALGAGIAMHAGLAVWYEGIAEGLTKVQRMEKGVEAIRVAWDPEHPSDDFRTLTRVQEMFLKYIQEYPQEPFEVLNVEVPFCIPLENAWLSCANSFLERTEAGLYVYDSRWECDGVADENGICQVCGRQCEVIEYGGIIDLITQFGHGKSSTIYIMDHKTTSQLGPTFFFQFKPNNQVTGYCWGAEKMSDRKIAGAQINALCLTKGGNISFKRELTGRDHTDYPEFRTDVIEKCNRICTFRRTGIWPKSTGQCQTKYGMCGYHGIHVLTDESERQSRRETDYVKRVWDFENRDGETA